MDRARDTIHFTISKESNDFVLSLLPNNYCGTVTVLFPLHLSYGTNIAFFDDKYPSIKGMDILKESLSKDGSCYLLQIKKDSLYFNQYLLAHLIIGETISQCNEEQDKLVGKLCKKLNHSANADSHSVTGQLYIKIMLQCLADILRSNEGFKSREEVLAKDFLALLESKNFPDHHVRYYAEQLFVSRRYLTLSVHRMLGRTPKNIIDSYLTEKAKELLQTRDTIYSISEYLQFDSPASFSNFFKKNTGITPSEYRKLI